jgi:hypothetical protein
VNGPSYLLSLDVVMEWRGMVVLCQYGIEDDIAGSFVELHFVWFGAGDNGARSTNLMVWRWEVKY